MQLPSEHLKLFWGAIGRRSTNGGERLLRDAAKHGWVCRSAFLDIIEPVVVGPEAHQSMLIGFADIYEAPTLSFDAV
jgi:hypothetical protein